MATYFVRGFRENTAGNIADAGPFEVYLNTETPTSKAGHSGNDLLVHDPYNSANSYLATNTVNGINYTGTITKAQLNAGIGLTTNVSGPNFIFRSVSNCTNNFNYIPPSPTPSPTTSPSTTPSRTPSVTPTISVTPSVTPTVTPTATVTPTISITATPTPTISITATPSQTPGASVTPSISISKTPSISVTPSVTATPSPSLSPGVSPTRTPSVSISPTRTPSRTPSPSKTPSISISKTPSTSVTPSVTPSRTPSTSVTPSISISPTPSPSKTPSKSVTPSTSDLGYTQFYASFGSTQTQACNQDDLVFWHDGNGTYPVAGDRLFSSANGGPVLGGYYAWNQASTVGIVNSSGYVQTIALCCFIAGTMISINGNDAVPVENLNTGDSVLSKNIPTLIDSDDSETLQNWSNASIAGNASTALVVSNKTEQVTEVYNVNNGLFKMTAAHLHIIKRNNVWTIVTAENLQVGDVFEDKDGNEVPVTSIAAESYNGLVYRLNVETDDVYYANGILTHNIK